GHEFIKRFDRTPPSRVKPQTWNTHSGCKLDAMNGMSDLFCNKCFVGRYKTLVDGKACKRDAVQEGVTLESLYVRVILTFHFTVEYVDALYANACGLINYLIDRKLLFREVPV